MNELTQLMVTNGATDSDVPANVLSYQLVNAPAGAAIGSSGMIPWTPTEAQGPGVYTLTTVVTDDGVPALSATNSFTVTVNEVNSAPVLPAQGNRTVNELAQLMVEQWSDRFRHSRQRADLSTDQSAGRSGD